MAKFLNKIFNEQGTSVLNISFKDERNRNIIPKTSNFQLSKLDYTIINNRTFANGAFTGNIVVLSGDDLAIFGDEDTRFRIFSVRATYDSTLGENLPCNCEIEFVITRLLNIPDKLIVDTEENLGGKIKIINSSQNNLDGKTYIINSDFEFINNLDAKVVITI